MEGQDKDLADFERDLRALLPREAEFGMGAIENAGTGTGTGAGAGAGVSAAANGSDSSRPVITKLFFAWSLGLAAGICGTLLSIRLLDSLSQPSDGSQTLTSIGSNLTEADTDSNDGSSVGSEDASNAERNDPPNNRAAQWPLREGFLGDSDASFSLSRLSIEGTGNLTPMSLLARNPLNPTFGSAANSDSNPANSNAKSPSQISFAKPVEIEEADPQTQRELLRKMLGKFESI